MTPRPGISKTTAALAVALVAVVLLTGVSYYADVSSPSNRGESQASSPSPTVGVSPTTAPPSSTSTSAVLAPSIRGSVIGQFMPSIPVISQFLPIGYTLYFSDLGYVPSPLTVTVTSPGINMTVNPTQIVVPSITLYSNTTVMMRPSPSLAPGVYPVRVQATGGGYNYTETLTVQVVKYLIASVGTGVWEPADYTVPIGTTITWLRLNGGATNGLSHVEGITGQMNVNMTPVLDVVSPDLLRYQTFTYTFTEPGVYHYHCDFVPTMVGVINVTA